MHISFSALACFALVVGGGRWCYGYLSVLVGRVSFLYFSLVFYPILFQRCVILDGFNKLVWVRVRSLSLNPSSIRLIPYLSSIFICFVLSFQSILSVDLIFWKYVWRRLWGTSRSRQVLTPLSFSTSDYYFFLRIFGLFGADRTGNETGISRACVKVVGVDLFIHLFILFIFPSFWIIVSIQNVFCLCMPLWKCVGSTACTRGER